MTKVKCDLGYCAYNENNVCTAAEIKMEKDWDYSEGCRTWDSEWVTAECQTSTVPSVFKHRHNQVVVYRDDDPDKYDLVDAEEYYKQQKAEWLAEAYHCPDCKAMYQDGSDVVDHSVESGHDIDEDRWNKLMEL